MKQSISPDSDGVASAFKALQEEDKISSMDFLGNSVAKKYKVSTEDKYSWHDYAKVHDLVYISLSKSLFQLKLQIWFQLHPRKKVFFEKLYFCIKISCFLVLVP